MSLKEYVITLHSHEDLDSFYEDMETPGGNLYIPDRAIDVFLRRPVSRNTHYMITEEEAVTIRKDPRVMAVELSMSEAGMEFRPNWSQSGSIWSKSNGVSGSYKNWGLLRSVEGLQRANWGSNGTTLVNGTINVTASGKHVDVVIVDGHMNPLHPEYAFNIDGTGLSRVVQYNWFSLNDIVNPSESRSTYVYTPYVDAVDQSYTDDNDHGAHVAGTVAGNTQGWAHDANIYNINPYSTNPNNYVSLFLDYIKIWHRNKPINPLTGRKNPTVTNHSYGITRTSSISSISSVRYRGNVYSGPFTSNQLLNYGIYNTGGTAYTPGYTTAYEQDVIDLINEGVIVVAAAGNDFTKVSNYSSTLSDDYNNYYIIGATTRYYMRGGNFANTPTILVGAVGALVNDSKSTFSNCGPRVDIYAPGRYIMSSVNSTTGAYANDSRNSEYHITKYSGTSMACPQVTGVLACLAESWPTMQQSQALTYIKNYAKLGQITATSGGPSDFTDLQGSTNRFLYFYKDRPDTGQVGPKINLGNRPSSGQAWPRTKIYRYGR